MIKKASLLSLQFFNAMQNVKYVILENKQTEDRRENSVKAITKLQLWKCPESMAGERVGGLGEERGKRLKNRDYILKPKNLFNAQVVK